MQQFLADLLYSDTPGSHWAFMFAGIFLQAIITAMMILCERRKAPIHIHYKIEPRLTPIQQEADKVLAKHVPGYDKETVNAMHTLSEALKKPAKPTTRSGKRKGAGKRGQK